MTEPGLVSDSTLHNTVQSNMLILGAVLTAFALAVRLNLQQAGRAFGGWLSRHYCYSASNTVLSQKQK